MAKVGILMGSDSDLPVMKKAADMLEKFGIEYEMKIISAHRMPDTFVDYATKAEDRGVEVIIAGAGRCCPSAWNVCCSIRSSGNRYSNPYKESGRCRQPLFYRADAFRYSGCNRCY